MLAARQRESAEVAVQNVSGSRVQRGPLRTIVSLLGHFSTQPRGTSAPVALRIISSLALFIVIAIIVCLGLAYVLAQQADDYLEAEHRQALSGAVQALQAVSPDLAKVEPELIRVLERASGLKELRFESEPVAGSRQVQSMLDRNGRIVGWFSWEPERPASTMMRRLLPIASLIAFGLVGFAAVAMWQLGRLGFKLATTEEQVEKLEFQDVLTGLPNHNRLFELFDHALATRQEDAALAFAALDLDGFDEINDALGYAGGDQVLKELGERLRKTLPEGAVIARLGSDEFALLILGMNREGTLQIAETVRHAIMRPIWMDQLVQISVSIGVAVAPGDGTTRDELTRRADLALRAAKRRARGSVLGFVEELETEFQEKRFIKREIALALTARAFDLHYQPIVKAEGSATVGVEALLRWNHPTRGFVPPSVFVPVAEEAGLMDRLGEFVLRQAIADASRWPDLYVSVNVSPVQMRDRAFVDLVSQVLAETGFAPARLLLEMTETVLLDDPEQATARLLELRALGIGLALDDFGSGYSSLSYLQRLPFNKLKVDRSFVAALDQSANAGVIIQAIVTLARALEMSVLIEGVETEDQRILLRLAGCNEMQGYLFAKPSARAEIDRLLERERAERGAARVALRAG
jgi:diguanylate cyclase (GGDEF)-like protein